MIKRWFFTKKAIKILTFIAFINILFMGIIFVGNIGNIREQGYSLMSLCLTLFIMIISVDLYNEYGHKIIIKRIEISSKTKRTLQIQVFLILIL